MWPQACGPLRHCTNFRNALAPVSISLFVGEYFREYASLSLSALSNLRQGGINSASWGSTSPSWTKEKLASRFSCSQMDQIQSDKQSVTICLNKNEVIARDIVHAGPQGFSLVPLLFILHTRAIVHLFCGDVRIQLEGDDTCTLEGEEWP